MPMSFWGLQIRIRPNDQNAILVYSHNSQNATKLLHNDLVRNHDGVCVYYFSMGFKEGKWSKCQSRLPYFQYFPKWQGKLIFLNHQVIIWFQWAINHSNSRTVGFQSSKSYSYLCLV